MCVSADSRKATPPTDWEDVGPAPPLEEVGNQGSLPAWMSARLFAASIGVAQPPEDAEFQEWSGIDAAYWPQSPPSAVMSDVVALAQAIAPHQDPTSVWATLERHTPALARALGDRGGWSNKSQALIKAVLTGHWAVALYSSGPLEGQTQSGKARWIRKPQFKLSNDTLNTANIHSGQMENVLNAWTTIPLLTLSRHVLSNHLALHGFACMSGVPTLSAHCTEQLTYSTSPAHPTHTRNTFHSPNASAPGKVHLY